MMFSEKISLALFRRQARSLLANFLLWHMLFYIVKLLWVSAFILSNMVYLMSKQQKKTTVTQFS